MNFKMGFLGAATVLLASFQTFAATTPTVKLVFSHGKDKVEQTIAVPAADFVDLTLENGAICKVDVTSYDATSRPVALYLDVSKTAAAGGPFKFFSAGGPLPEKGFGMVQLLVDDYWCFVQQK